MDFKYIYKISFLLFFITTTISTSQDENKSIMLQEERSAIQVIKGDTVDYNQLPVRTELSTDVQKDSADRQLPGDRQTQGFYTEEQDSAYKEALKMRIPIITRLKLDLMSSEDLWELQKELSKSSKWALAFRTMQNIPREWYEPIPIEVVQHEVNIMNSFYVPGVNTYSPYGTKISFSTIGQMLGLTEDVSPIISYQLDHFTEVEVVVYSVQAVVVATIFKGPQPKGSYTYTWNGRSDNGKKMPAGDYIGEVRIGKEKLIRKRIRLE